MLCMCSRNSSLCSTGTQYAVCIQCTTHTYKGISTFLSCIVGVGRPSSSHARRGYVEHSTLLYSTVLLLSPSQPPLLGRDTRTVRYSRQRERRNLLQGKISRLDHIHLIFPHKNFAMFKYNVLFTLQRRTQLMQWRYEYVDAHKQV